MKVRVKVDDGKIAVLDSETDKVIYEAPHNPPNTGTAYTSGTDLYLHVTKRGRKVFYLYHWSMWQGVEDRIEVISESEAKDFIIEKAGLTGWAALTEREIEKAKSIWGQDFLEETA